jgi:hypothetical protein
VALCRKSKVVPPRNTGASKGGKPVEGTKVEVKAGGQEEPTKKAGCCG